jgi:hypothetical protein
MRIHELPTHLLRSLAARCQGYNAAVGDRRIVLRAVVDACHDEIDRRMVGGDFPQISVEAEKTFAALITSSPPVEFARIIFELEGDEADGALEEES